MMGAIFVRFIVSSTPCSKRNIESEASFFETSLSSGTTYLYKSCLRLIYKFMKLYLEYA